MIGRAIATGIFALYRGAAFAAAPFVGHLLRKRLARGRDGASSANLTWTRADLDALPFSEASFDLALLSQVLHGLEAPRAALRTRG